MLLCYDVHVEETSGEHDHSEDPDSEDSTQTTHHRAHGIHCSYK